MLFRTLQKLTAADLLDLQRLTETWETFVTTWRSDGTAVSLGNGTLTGRKLIYGKTRVNLINLIAGSTTTFGTGNYFWHLSDTTRSSDDVIAGNALAIDASPFTRHHAGASVATSGTEVICTTGSSTVTATSPFTWAVNDKISILVEFEVA